MIIGTLEVDIRLFSPNSLKEKRRIIKSLISRIRSKFNVSIAEVGDHSLWQRARLGIVLLSPNTSYSNRILDKILDCMEKEKDFFIVECKKEIL